jgi:hypothetical protein
MASTVVSPSSVWLTPSCCDCTPRPPAKPYITIPAALRYRCGLRTGDRVLLAVFPGRDALAAYSFAVVDQALRAHAPFPHDEGGQP